MKEREELELIPNLMRKYNLPMSPILEYAIKEKMGEFPALGSANEDGEDALENQEDDTYTYSHVMDIDLSSISHDVKQFCLSALECLEGKLDKRCYSILTDTLKGESRREIAEKYYLTQERIRQIVAKTIRQAKELLIEQRKNIEETKAENARLNSQLKLLEEDLVRLKVFLPEEASISLGYENKEMSAELISLLETPINNTRLPVRAVKTLMGMGIKKFSDIAQIDSYMQVLKERNSGRKTVHDISIMLEDFNLTFGMTYTEIVNVLKVEIWHSAKSKWIREYENIKIEKNQKEEKESTEFSHSQKTKELEKAVYRALKHFSVSASSNDIMYVVKRFLPSNFNLSSSDVEKVLNSMGDAVLMNHGRYKLNINKVIQSDNRAKLQTGIDTEIKKGETIEGSTILTREIIEAARTPNGGFTKSQLAAIGIEWPAPQDWIEQKVGTKITESQLERFNRIEYVSKPTSFTTFKRGDRTYRDVAYNETERRQMEAVLAALSHFDSPATPRDVVRTVSRSAWGNNLNEESIDSILKMLPEVEYIKWGKYILKSRKNKMNDDVSG